jgi:hypothetical protein
MFRILRRPAAVFGVLLFAGQGLAQEPPGLAPGSRLRITASSLDGPIRGTLASLSDDSLTLETKDAAPLVIERSRITRLEVSAGHRSRNRGAAIGAAVGLGVGLLFTAVVAATESCEGYNAEDCGLATGVSLILFTPVLTGAGALIGVAVTPGERWVRVPPQAHAAGSSPPLGLGLVVRF